MIALSITGFAPSLFDAVTSKASVHAGLTGLTGLTVSRACARKKRPHFIHS
jgi:hypothetical protein